jgi:hypothetical protein
MNDPRDADGAAEDTCGGLHTLNAGTGAVLVEGLS